ncbi:MULTISPECIES: chromosomal replication initiator protein DnaA [Helicobacter]|uniref:Chromosomal replication initiator protein DnaA n=1 Tax=Helicobacter ibis TaxID=2962633 RepID=A0ABT4VET8_9HELI|nr:MULTISPECIES: chromosomal replication initiator protein DnaA [Helicobacter]MDA3967096.1 chromosomal replication initiator protein DnaA [Helicobacter sp. WB40]MDA3969226.1 chromosomal replication initiator protein DnaA [Helicobacter ibis]
MHNILLKLKDKITPVEFENYIQQLTYNNKDSRDDRAVFNVPHMRLVSWIHRRYANKIAEIFEEETGIKPDVIIEVLGASKKKETRLNIRKAQNASNLNLSLTFDSFVVGNSNKFAFDVAKVVAQNQGSKYNPLMIYGATGLGKTHLLNAIGNANTSVGKNVIYTTSEQFLNDFLNNLKTNNMENFRNKYRKCDYLLIDDVQFFIGKSQIQEELFHTFNQLQNDNKQIVLTSDCPPKDMDGLEDRLKGRFTRGLLANITPPELETKINIIKTKCATDGIHLKDDIINFIAASINDNIREIEGILIKLNFSITLTNMQDVTIEFVRDILKEYIKEKKENISLESIIEIVAKYFNIKPSDIKGKNRTQSIAIARKITIYLAIKLTPNSTPEIAKVFNMKSPSSISKAMKSITEEINKGGNISIIINDLKSKIK